MVKTKSQTIAEAVQDLFDSDSFIAKIENLATKIATDIVNKSFAKLQDFIDRNEGRLHDIEVKVEAKKQELSKLQKSIDTHHDKIHNLEVATNQLEQYSRRSCLRVFGIKESPGENTDDIVCDLATNKMGVTLTQDDIDRSHRTGAKKPNAGRPRPIIIKFTSYKKRSEFIRARRKLKGTKTTIQEDLTTKNQELYTKTFKCKDVLASWTSDGRIFALVKATDGKEVRKLITCTHDLDILSKAN